MYIVKFNSALVFCCGTNSTQNVQVKPTHMIFNITTGTVTSSLPDAVSGPIMSVLFIILLNSYFGVYKHSVGIMKRHHLHLQCVSIVLTSI